jgi:hypothetical protein
MQVKRLPGKVEGGAERKKTVASPVGGTTVLEKYPRSICDEWSRCETGVRRACSAQAPDNDPGQRYKFGPSAVMSTERYGSLIAGRCYGWAASSQLTNLALL